MDDLHARRSTNARHAIEQVLHRWHPEAFPTHRQGLAGAYSYVIEIYNIINKWMDADMLATFLLSLERRKLGVRPSNEPICRAVSAELLAIDFDAITGREGCASPSA